jgi:hypothetical protein
MKFSISGSDELKGQIRKLPKQFKDASAVGQANAAQDIMALSKTRAPYEDGDLEAGAFVGDVDYTAHSVVVDFGYEGVPYLARQHEDLTLNHPGLKSKTKNPGRAAQGEAKFLESAMNDLDRSAQRSVAKAIDFFLRTGLLPKVVSRGVRFK